jgi:Patatin-like phospholipase
VVRANAPDRSAHLSSLAVLLKSAGPAAPVFIVAASGGGTRAAVYSATVLEGLRSLRMAGRIILMSGVSGGGVAAAYFYAHRDALLDLSAESDAEWIRFKKRMAEPFIGDVLEGAGEWRVVSREPLARLLVESFERRLFTIDRRQATVGDSDQLALILNTTITAHPQEDSDLLRGAFTNSTSASAPCDVRHIPYGLMGGGRLLFTNLQARNAFPPSGAVTPATAEIQVPDVRLPYVVVQDPQVSLAAASALTANFPPVFTSARVDVASEVADRACPYRTYYVTDGGANENLGLVSALYALRAALAELAPGEIPAIHIVTIEASETTYDYTPDRGIEAVINSAKERLTGGLTQELLNDVKRLAIDATGDAKRVQIHDLALPLAFRSRGGFGTHWMFPGSIVIANPRLAQPRGAYQHLIPHILAKDSDSAALDQQQIVALWTALHDPDRDFRGRSWDTDSRRVAGWICGIPADLHIAEWRRLVDSVRAAP